jgi:hypothetical protein
MEDKARRREGGAMSKEDKTQRVVFGQPLSQRYWKKIAENSAKMLADMIPSRP